jgi:uncharacterized protein with HEPN domain
MRPEKLYLVDIIEASKAIGRFCESVGEDEFLKDELRQSAVLQKLIVIGEAASRLPKEFKAHHTEIEWEFIVGFRNIAIHEYFAILWEIVWNTAIHSVPDLSEKVVEILEKEYQGEE